MHFQIEKYCNFSGTVVDGVQYRPFSSLLGHSVRGQSRLPGHTWSRQGSTWLRDSPSHTLEQKVYFTFTLLTFPQFSEILEHEET